MNKIQSLIENTKIRSMRPDDFGLYHSLRSDSRIDHLMGSGQPWSETTHKRWFDGEIDVYDKVNMTIEYRGIPVGIVSLYNIEHIDHNCSLGVRILPEYINKGVAEMACYYVLKIAFDRMNMRKVKASYIDYNKASANVQKRNGFQLQGIFKDDDWVDGRYWDRIQMALFREGFEKLKERFNKYKGGPNSGKP
jgi:RimJ/RimL family protein N-acetyltransferase